MQNVDAGTEPYEAARRLLAGTSRYTYVCQGPLASRDVPSLRVAGFDSQLHRHGDSNPIVSMLQIYPSGVIPVEDEPLGYGEVISPMWRDYLPETIRDALNSRFGKHGLTPVLSHIAVGSAASTPLLTPAASTENRFGTLLVVLPTFSCGGHVTVQYMGFSTTLVTTMTHATYAVVHRSASASMTPVTAGHVVVAVFDLVGHCPLHEAPPLSPEFEATVAALIDVALAPPVTHTMIGFAVHRGIAREPFSRPFHPSPDGAFLAALLASKVYDVADVIVQPDHADVDHPLGIFRATMHPAMGLEPDSMYDLHNAIPAFLRNVGTVDLHRLGAKTCLVFWPTARRAHALGPEKCIFFSGPLPTPGALDVVEPEPSEVWDDPFDLDSIHTHGGPLFAKLGRHVNDVGDLGLVERFWDWRVTTACSIDLRHFAPTVHRALMFFGIDALMPALEDLLSIWQETWVGFANGVRLVASLFGVSDKAAVCPRLPLSVTHVLRLYTVLFPTSAPRYWEEDCSKQLAQAALLDALRLESYLWDDLLDGAMLPELGDRVRAFLLPARRLEALVTECTEDDDTIFHPWMVLAPAVLALAPTRLAWCDARLRATATSCTVNRVGIVARDVANVLCALHAMNALDQATLQRIVLMACRKAPKALWMFFNEVADAAQRYLAHVLPLLVNPNEVELRYMVLNEGTCTIEMLSRWSPPSLDLLSGLIFNRDNNPDLHHAFVRRLQRAATPFDRELALTTLRALEAEDNAVQNESVAFVDVALAPCCNHCHDFQAFLRSPTKVTYFGHRNTYMCATIKAFALAHAQLIDMIRLDDDDGVVVTKRLPLHERRDQAAIMMKWLQRRLAQDNHARRHANTVDGTINTVDDDDDEPPSKRLKAQ